MKSSKDRVLMLFIAPSILVSAYFSAKVLWGLWVSGGTIDEVLAVTFGAIFITAAEIFCFRRYILRSDYIALILGFLIATVSIIGSFGAFQTGFVRNLLSSDSYTAAQRAVDNLDKQIESKQRQADQFAAENQKWNERAARRELQELNKQRENAYKDMQYASENGKAEGNAVYSGIGAFFAMPEDKAARNMNGYIALIVEIIMISLVIWDAIDERDGTPSPRKEANREMEKELRPVRTSHNGNGVHEKKNSMKSKGNKGRKTQSSNMKKRLEKLRRIYENDEKFSTKKELAEKVGIGTETLNDYLNKLDLDFDLDFSMPKNADDLELARQFEVDEQNSRSKPDEKFDIKNTKKERKERLKKYIEKNPDASLTEMAFAAEIPPELIREYLNEIDDAPQYTRQGA